MSCGECEVVGHFAVWGHFLYKSRIKTLHMSMRFEANVT